MNTQHVDGQKNREVFLYTLSTCVWCKKTKQLLKDLDVDYEYIDVDLASEEDKEIINAEFKKKKLVRSFPVVIVEDKNVIQGYKPSELNNLFQ